MIMKKTPKPMIEFDKENHIYTVDGKAVPSVTEICELLSERKYGQINPSVLAQAAARGTTVHELCELYDYDALPEEIDADLVPYVSAYIQFVNDYSPDWIFVEKQLSNGEYAGTADRIGVIDGELRIVDLKTTASMDRIAKISLACQLAGYSNLLSDQYGMDALYDKCFGVQLKKDGTYQVITYQSVCEKYDCECHRLFDDLLDITHIIRGDV